MLDALGVAVCLADEDELLYVNEAFERLTGWTAEAALGCGLDATVLGEVERPGRSLVTDPPPRRRERAVRADVHRGRRRRLLGGRPGPDRACRAPTRRR